MICIFVVTGRQMYLAECNAVKRGLDFSLLMERAGNACANETIEHFSSLCEKGSRIVVLCGKGKNGGDGFVIAFRLWERGSRVITCLVDGEPTDEISRNNYEMLKNTGSVIIKNDNMTGIKEEILKADLIVDAIYGTGFKGELKSEISLITSLVNSVQAKVVSVDVPSGTECDAACGDPNAVKADLTVAISAYKSIHIMKTGMPFCGKTVVADIGMVKEDYEKLDSVVFRTLNDSEAAKMLPPRYTVSNKGTYGTALLACGSAKMPGAACIAACGALRSGAGLVKLVFPFSAYAPVTSKLTEAVFVPVNSNEEGTFNRACEGEILKQTKMSTALLMGCGMGFNKDTVDLTHGVVTKCEIPLVLDADALNALSANVSALRQAKAPVIVTPHPGEMSRLCGKTIKEITDDPVGTAYNFSKRYGVITVLKTANTVVCSPDGQIYINATGNSGLSKGGSGDLLAGMMVSLLAQGMKPYDCAVLSVYLHGKCADEVAAKLSRRGMLVSDMINHLAEFYGQFE